jgi:hypothetical protein
MSTTPADFFKDNKYVVIRNFLNQDTVTLLYQYSLIKVASTDFKYNFEKKSYNEIWDGRWDDPQVPHVYSHYGDPIMDSILNLSTQSISEHTGLDLKPNYTYWRLYEKESILTRHRDRDSCEISATVCLGYNNSNVSEDDYPNYNWPMWVEGPSGDAIPIQLNPGDAIIYRGCEVDHWRDTFKGLNHAQVFLHYSDTNGPFNISLDGRPMLGIPKEFQGNVNQ